MNIAAEAGLRAVSDSDDKSTPTTRSTAPVEQRKKRTSKRKRSTRKKAKTTGRSRAVRMFPSATFEDSLIIIHGIQKYAAGQRVRRLTLLRELDLSPSSSATRMLITNSGQYGLTKGSYAAEWIEPTAEGLAATDPKKSMKERRAASFGLAIEAIEPFRVLYEEYKGRHLAGNEVLKDVVRNAGVPEEHLSECIEPSS